MKKGKIKSLKAGYGFITPDEGGPDVYFRANAIRGGRFGGLEEGLEVAYEAEAMDDGRVQAIQVDVPEYRFLNPYNFVRLLDPNPNTIFESQVTSGGTIADQLTAQSRRRSPQAPRSSEVPKEDIRLLGQCQPPPHDRYLGLSGKIRCEVEAITPLFVSDSEKIQVQIEHKSYLVSDSEEIQVQTEHKSYRFFQLDGAPALPATSLRGAVRAVFEAVTNSCFAIFKGDMQLSYRLKPQEILDWVPARVERENDDKLYLHLLPGTSEIEIDRQPNPMYAAWIPRYRLSTPVSLPSGLGHGNECAALIERVNTPYWKVLQLDKDPGKLKKSSPNQNIIQRGWLCITNQNIENKRNERYFFRAPGNGSLAQPIPVNSTVEKDYNKLIDEYQERHCDDVQKRQARRLPPERFIDDSHPAFSPFIYKRSAHLAKGDLVYAQLSGTQKRPVVTHLIPVAVGRVFYEERIRNLLIPRSLHACEKYEALCPACRMFGWVKGAYKEKSAQQNDPHIRTAYKGRILFTHGKLIKSAGQLPATPLAILSSPKPTTTRFYLMPRSGQPQDGLRSEQAGYDGNNRLRGRKFYRHHGEAKPDEYQRAGGIPDNQNRTVRDALLPGAKFTFDIEFSNLASVELGALLFSLELDGKGYHHLGYAKPLGFGSVKLTMTDFFVLEPAQRYRSLDNAGWKLVERSQRQTWVEQFKQAMAEKYRHIKPTFDDLPNVQDLLALLGEPQTQYPIHYPRSTRSPQKEGKNFEWFVGNNREPSGPGYVLKPTVADKEGLPLLDKNGNEL